MREDRQARLQRKRVENAARRARERYLARLPEELLTHLAACRMVQGEGPIGVRPWFSVDAEGVGYGETRHRSPNSDYYRFGWAEKALAQVARLGPSHDAADAYFCPFGENPIYRVNFGWVRRRWGMLWAFSPEMLGVVRQDYRAGIFITHYCGQLPGEWNPDEVVYEEQWRCKGMLCRPFTMPLSREISQGSPPR